MYRKCIEKNQRSNHRKNIQKKTKEVIIEKNVQKMYGKN